MKCPVTGEPNCKCTIRETYQFDTNPKETLRKLWTDHVLYTILLLTDMNQQTLDPDIDRLLQNQIDIGTYIGSFIGIQEGTSFVQLLTEHIHLVVACIKSFISNQSNEFTKVMSSIMENATQVGSYLYRVSSTDIVEEECQKWFTIHSQHMIDLMVTLYHQDRSLRSKIIDSYYNHMLYVSDSIYYIVLKKYRL